MGSRSDQIAMFLCVAACDDDLRKELFDAIAIIKKAGIELSELCPLLVANHEQVVGFKIEGKQWSELFRLVEIALNIIDSNGKDITPDKLFSRFNNGAQSDG